MRLLHTVTLQDVRKTVKVDSKNNKNVHIPRFLLLAPLKPTFGIGTGEQRFGCRSSTMNIVPVELLTNSFSGNKRVVVLNLI